MTSIPRPILVLGLSSLIGRRLPALAAARDLKLVGISRSPREAAPGVLWVTADLQAPAPVLPAAAKVVSLSPIWLLTPPVLEALHQGGARRIVAFSSTSRFTKAESPVAEERAVAARLAEGEARLQAFCGARGIAWTVLRPTLIYAEGEDGNVSRLAALIRRFGVLPLAGRGMGLRQPVHAQDLAQAALDALAAPGALDRAYDLPGGETLSYRAMAVRIFEGLGRRPRLIYLPPPLWTAALRLAGPLLPGVTAGMGLRMDADLAFDGAPATRDFGWRPRDFHPRF